MPSMAIYSYELFNFYDVDNIIRVGTAGVINPSLKVRDVVFGQGACTNSNFEKQFNLPGTYAPICSFELLEKAVNAAKDMGIDPIVGNLYSSDIFYDDAQSLKDWQKMGVLATEMEAAALYMNAARAGKNALAICTISDNPFTGEVTTPEERQNTFTTMMKIALEVAIA
ncbi:MAG: purine-nucleoside phosphorylase, partial [Firmicutes bacterium]|nr:purine-nucleoside phosphorylase [Bacillota bacterium]